MIVQVKDTVIAVVVPQKCGISTVTNMLAYHLTNKVLSKTKCRRTLSNTGYLINPGQLEETFFIDWCNPKPDLVFAVVRDPIDRLLSAYRDRVYTKNMDEFENCSWEWFCNNFKDLVLQGTDVGRHCRPQVDWLGRDANRYHTVFNTQDLNTKFKTIIEDITGVPIPDLFENVSDHFDIAITNEQKKFFADYYARDYEFISQATGLSKFA